MKDVMSWVVLFAVIALAVAVIFRTDAIRKAVTGVA